MKIIQALISTTLYVIILAFTYYCHILFFQVNVVFYAAIFDAIIASTLMGLIIIYFNLFKHITNFEKTLLIIIWTIFGYSFAISIPTVIDRSLSFYILEKIQQRGGGVKIDRIEEIFVKEYIKEARLVDVRITEALESGTIIIKDNCVLLTHKGEAIATFGRSFRQNFLPKKRLLMNEYTDELTDPFRKSTINPSYTCSL
jgi:hypothetical protein